MPTTDPVPDTSAAAGRRGLRARLGALSAATPDSPAGAARARRRSKLRRRMANVAGLMAALVLTGVGYSAIAPANAADEAPATESSAVEAGAELRQGVDLGLDPSPVVAGPPVLAELLRVLQRDALGPAPDGGRVRPAGPSQALAQVVELGVGDVDPEITHAITVTRRRPRPRIGSITIGAPPGEPGPTSGVFRTWRRVRG